MIYDLQKASIWKRISAGLFDFIILGMLCVGFAALLSLVLGSDAHNDNLEKFYVEYGEEMNVDFNISQEDYYALSESERARYDQALLDLYNNDEFVYSYYMVFNLTFIITIFSILLGFLVLEFFVPLIFKNGQTLGKKIFNIAVMRNDGVRISGPLLFTRAILGKYTVETMLPIIFILMVLFQITSGMSALIAIGAIYLTHIVMMIISKHNCGIHDMISNTVTVDLSSQLIFDSPEALLEYKKKVHAEEAEKADYR